MKKFMLIAVALLLSSCASSQPVKQDRFAVLAISRTYTSDFQRTWKAIEFSVAQMTVIERSPSEVSNLEWNKIQDRKLKTDWIFTRSRDKYVEYKINSVPQRMPLEMKYKYEVTTKRVMGGTLVTVKTEEEVQKIDTQGNPNGYSSADKVDTSRSNELLDKINIALLSLPN